MLHCVNREHLQGHHHVEAASLIRAQLGANELFYFLAQHFESEIHWVVLVFLARRNFPAGFAHHCAGILWTRTGLRATLFSLTDSLPEKLRLLFVIHLLLEQLGVMMDLLL